MPRYHFNILDGVRMPDADGIDLPDWHAARLEAVRRAGEILKDEPQSIALGEDWRIEVTDHTGLILFQMTFLMVESPVMRREDIRERCPDGLASIPHVEDGLMSNPGIPDPGSPDLPTPGEPPPTEPVPGDPPMPAPPPDPVPGDPVGPDIGPSDPVGPGTIM